MLIGAGGEAIAPQEPCGRPSQAYPPAAPVFDELRHARKRPRRPAVAVLSGHGTVDPRHPAFEEGALVLTSETGAARLRGRLPRAATMLTVWSDAARIPSERSL